MLEGIYIVGAVLLFLAQLRNGFFMALITAVFWPVVLIGLSVFQLMVPLIAMALAPSKGSIKKSDKDML